MLDFGPPACDCSGMESTPGSDDVSPFARVPSADAGPKPLQDGPITYEKMISSMGGVSLGNQPSRWSALRVLVVVLILAAVAVPIAIMLAR